MNIKKNVNQLIETTIQNAGDIERAKPQPFLLTRINARLSITKTSRWAFAVAYMSKPVFLMSIFATIVLVNAVVIFMDVQNVVPTFTEQTFTLKADEFLSTSTNFYETYNP